MKIALDAMGGDKAPAINVVGARDALALYPQIEELHLVGDSAVVEKECAAQNLTDSRVKIVHAEETIDWYRDNSALKSGG